MASHAHTEPLHTRCLHINVIRQDGERMRAHGDILDLRKAGFIPMGGDFQAAGIIHKMEIDAVVRGDRRVLERVEAAQPVVAFEATEATSGESCRDPIGLLQALVGESVDGDFPAALGRTLGGPRACSHILTLFQAMASALPRALDLEAAGLAAGAPPRRNGERIFQRSLFLDGLSAEGGVDLVVRLADVFTRPHAAVADDPMARLARQDEVRLRGSVAFPAMELRSIEARERHRGADDYDDAAWRDRGPRVEGLVGRTLTSGFAAELFRHFGSDAEDRGLLDALLSLAPGFIQVMAALSDDMRVAAPKGDDRPTYTPIGGQENSCYMMRSESPTLQIRTRR